MSTMWKSTFREIRQSFGRFFAIMAIVALGVSLFAGMKVTRACMVKTTGDYLTEKDFYDYRILSTVGYDEQDVEAMRKQEGGRAAEGTVALDILCTLQKGNEMVLKMYSLPQEVNKLELKAGRLPGSADECVADSSLCSKEDIGKKIVLAESNEVADLENFAYTEYTIVGIVQSPLYIQYERGNTSLGSGRLSGFAYIPMDGFAIDYFTEVYVKFDKDFEMYSDEYTAYMDEKEEAWEELAAALAGERYDRVKADAEKELADAEEELAEGKAEGEQELSDAWQELEDARLEIEDGEAQLADGEKELADALKTLEKKEKELADAESTIAAEEMKLTDGEAELERNLALWQEQKNNLTSGKSELSAGQAQLTGESAVITRSEAQLTAAETQLAEQEQELKARETTLNAKEVQLLALQSIAVTEELKSQVEQGLAEIAGYRSQIADGWNQINEAKARITEGKAALESGKATVNDYRNQLNEGNARIALGEEELNKSYKQLLEAQIQLAEGKVQLLDAKAQLADGRSQINKGWQDLKEGQEELADARKELEDGKLKYEDGLAEYEDGMKEYEEEIADAEKQIADAKKKLAEMENPDSYVLGRKTNVGYVCFENDSGIVDGIADVFPIFFFAVAALVCITTMNRMVEEQRTQIGVLKALGYSQASIMCKYLFYSGTAAASGCILGYLLGIWLFPLVIWYAYGIMYKVDSLKFVFDGKLAAVSLAVSMLCSIGTTWLSCRYELSEVAAQLMRPKAPKAGQRVLLERVPFIWKRLKFLYKVSYRNIFRYKKRFFMMVVGISGCTALLVTGFGIKDSVGHVADHQYGRIQIYDASATFSNVLTDESYRELDEALEEKSIGYTVVMETTMDLIVNGQNKSLYLVAADENEDISPYLSLHTEDGEAVSYPELGKCVISQNMAKQYGVEPGDRITLRDENMREMELEVSGFNVNYISNYVYISTRTYEQLMGESASCKTVYINLEEDVDAHRLSASLMKIEGVASVTINADMLDRFGSMLGSMDLIILVIILCAAGLAFIVLYNLTNINITERIREIATIKVLGFYKNETASYVFRENVVLTFIGALVGLVLGKYFHRFVMAAIKIDMVCFDVNIAPISYLYSLMMTLAFSWFVNRFMGKKLERISMTESLKSVD